MSARPVTEHVFRVSLTMVNVFLIVLPDGITMVDAGIAAELARASSKAIAGAGQAAGRGHRHRGHPSACRPHRRSGGGARRDGRARLDAPARRPHGRPRASPRRPTKPPPGSITGQALRTVRRHHRRRRSPPVAADGLVNDRQEIPVAGGLLPILTPGHTAGHVSYLWPRDRGVLFVGDAAARGRAAEGLAHL